MCLQPLSRQRPRSAARPLGRGLSHGHVPLWGADGAHWTEGLVEVGLWKQQLVQHQSKVNYSICYTEKAEKDLILLFDAVGAGGEGDDALLVIVGIVQIRMQCCCHPWGSSWLCSGELLARCWCSCQQCNFDVPMQLFSSHPSESKGKQKLKSALSFLLVSP